MLINEYLPEFDFREYHELKVKGTQQEIYASMLTTNIKKSLLIRLLFGLRGMSSQFGQIKDLDKLGFVRLDEVVDEELLFGRITSSPSFSDCNPGISPQQFKFKSSRGFIRAVINFRAASIKENTTLVSTETRVHCGDEKIRNKFSVYWFFISPFSRLIRHLMLRQIEKQVNNIKQCTS